VVVNLEDKRVEDLVIDGSTEVDCMEIAWKDVD
jgi:hypothetical protein